MKNTGDLLHYVIREPKIKTDKPPLIILMHGVGSNEQDLFSFANQFPDSFLVVSLRGPYTIGPNSYAWYQMGFSDGKPVINAEQAEKSRNVIIQFLAQLQLQHPYNDKEVYLCGFSQGAIMSYSVGLTRPDLIKGIIVMSGRLLDEVKPAIAHTDKLKELHVFISHGTIDNVLDIHYARESAAYLKTLGIHPTYNEYADGHTINSRMLSDMLIWLHKN